MIPFRPAKGMAAPPNGSVVTVTGIMAVETEEDGAVAGVIEDARLEY